MRQLQKKEIKKLSKEFKRDKTIYLLLENIEYARNVAIMFRVADAAGVRKVFLTGISHLPPFGKDLVKVSRHKEKSIDWAGNKTSGEVINSLKRQGFEIIAVELTDKAMPIDQLKNYLEGKDKICFVAGSEVYGVNKKTLERCDSSVFIPMYGRGASLNVASSVAITLFSF